MILVDSMHRAYGIRPCVGEEDLARVWFHIGESVQDMGEVFSRQILGLVVAPVDGPEQSSQQLASPSKGDARTS